MVNAIHVFFCSLKDVLHLNNQSKCTTSWWTPPSNTIVYCCLLFHRLFWISISSMIWIFSSITSWQLMTSFFLMIIMGYLLDVDILNWNIDILFWVWNMTASIQSFGSLFLWFLIRWLNIKLHKWMILGT